MSVAMERTREERKKKSLIGRLMGRTPEDESVDHDRIFPDVNFESRRGPTTNGLNDREIHPSFSKGSSTARPDGVAGIVAGEEVTKT
jgi:hypothetical protein